jgi:hypothetical protein
MVAPFGDAAQVDRVLVFIAYDETDQVDIKKARLLARSLTWRTAWLARVTLNDGV